MLGRLSVSLTYVAMQFLIKFTHPHYNYCHTVFLCISGNALTAEGSVKFACPLETFGARAPPQPDGRRGRRPFQFDSFQEGLMLKFDNIDRTRPISHPGGGAHHLVKLAARYLRAHIIPLP